MEPDILRVQVWGMFLQSVAFGLYATTCWSCFRVFFTTRTHRTGLSEINWPMLAVFLIFLCKTTSSIGLHLHLNLGMATADSRQEAVSQFTNTSDRINISKSATTLVQTVLSSGFMIYRCWITYHRSWLVLTLPLVLWFGSVAIMGIVIHIDAAQRAEGFFSTSQSQNFGSSFWAIVMTVNIITTGLIVRRMWRIDHLRNRPDLYADSEGSTSPTTKTPSVCIISGQSHTKMKQASRIIVESGFLYTTVTIITFFLFVATSVAVSAALDVLVQVIGISFNLIVISNRPRGESSSSLSHLNNLPLQFVSSNMSVPGSAIEFAYPKHFTPRRKNRPPATPVQDDNGIMGGAGIPNDRDQSQQTI